MAVQIDFKNDLSNVLVYEVNPTLCRQEVMVTIPAGVTIEPGTVICLPDGDDTYRLPYRSSDGLTVFIDRPVVVCERVSNDGSSSNDFKVTVFLKNVVLRKQGIVFVNDPSGVALTSTDINSMLEEMVARVKEDGYNDSYKKIKLEPYKII